MNRIIEIMKVCIIYILYIINKLFKTKTYDANTKSGQNRQIRKKSVVKTATQDDTDISMLLQTQVSDILAKQFYTGLNNVYTTDNTCFTKPVTDSEDDNISEIS